MSARDGTYGIGQEAEQEAARKLAGNGWIVIPVSEFTNNIGLKINAPMLVIPDGVCISPDLLAIKPAKSLWFEVKKKTEPTYTWKLRRWEHGTDKPNIDAYQVIQEKTAAPVYLLVQEENSPQTHDLYLNNFDDIDARRKMKADLRPSRIWLWISLNDALRYGNVRNNNREMIGKNNPNGEGLYWPRTRMKTW